MRHRDRVEAEDDLIDAALEVLSEIKEATRELVDSAAYHRAAADDLRDVAKRLTEGE